MQNVECRLSFSLQPHYVRVRVRFGLLNFIIICQHFSYSKLDSYRPVIPVMRHLRESILESKNLYQS